MTRRVRFHERNLRRLAGRVRVVRAEHTLAELDAIAAAVDEAADPFIGGWGDEGVLVRAVYVDAGRVLVQVVAARDDYADVLRERFGPAVKAERVGRRHECAHDTFG